MFEFFLFLTWELWTTEELGSWELLVLLVRLELDLEWFEWLLRETNDWRWAVDSGDSTGEYCKAEVGSKVINEGK